jgi:hypothetical protein
MEEPLAWTGTFRGAQRDLSVAASPDKPFTTDLASVPRSLTWLFPRYGKYTKAAILHDFLCQNFQKPARTAAVAQSLLPLRDRSDADEVFLVLMGELKVPWLRRSLMWTAVSWATLLTSLVPGRRSKPVLRWVGRGAVLCSLVALAVLFALRPGRSSLAEVLLLLPAAVLVGGTLALGRGDRARTYPVVYVLTVVFSPLLAMGIVLGIALFGYLFIEDLVSGLPATRRFVADLFSPAAKAQKIATPQFARIAAVYES